MKRFLTFATVVVLAVVASGLLLAQSNPSIGSWKLNVAKSKYNNALPPKSEMRTVEAQGNGMKITFEGVAGDGGRIAWSFTTDLDGKESPISGVGAPSGEDTIAVKRVNANTITSTGTKAGKVVRTTRTVVSEDGKATTITAKGTNEQGQPTGATTVWDKQ